MKSNMLKRIAIITASMSLLLLLVLGIHIYLVTRPGRATEAQRVMARIDIKQEINGEDAEKITAWLYGQPGVDHVLCNAGTRIAVFTFSPSENNADKIVAAFKSATNYRADRYMPSTNDMRAGCPVAAGSWADKVYGVFKKM